MTQDQLFLDSEGDRYHERNRRHSFSLDLDPPSRLLALYGTTPSRVLEIGAGDGRRVSALASRYNCDVTAVEPSESAIADGQAAHPEVRFVRGTAAQPNLEPSESFDIVIVNFVLHWVDRSTLDQSLQEIERHVPLGGLLVVGDFLPHKPQSVEYHHLPGQGVLTFKEDYPSLFIGRGGWEVVAVLTGTMRGELVPDAGERDRAGWTLLRRSGPAGQPDEVT